MNFDKLLQKAKALALRLAQSKIERIITKAKKAKGVSAEASDEAVILAGKGLKARAVTDPEIRDIAR